MNTHRVVPTRPPITPAWRKDAACIDDPNPNRWVDLPPVRIRGVNNPAYDEALTELAATCAACPVAAHCLWESLDMNVRGVFAGTDEFERADLREQLNLPTPPRFPLPENDEDARLVEQHFTVLRLARRGMSNTEISALLDVSPMTVSRMTASEDSPAARRSKPKPNHPEATAPDPRTDHTRNVTTDHLHPQMS